MQSTQPGERAQPIKSCQPEYLSSVSRAHVKKLGVIQCTCEPNAGEDGETKDLWPQDHPTGKFRTSERPCLHLKVGSA